MQQLELVFHSATGFKISDYLKYFITVIIETGLILTSVTVREKKNNV